MSKVPQLKPTKEVDDFNLEDLDTLLSQLTEEEIDELNGDFDPDVRILFKTSGFTLGF